jgi:parallel beta-helix repeat protein
MLKRALASIVFLVFASGGSAQVSLAQNLLFHGNDTAANNRNNGPSAVDASPAQAHGSVFVSNSTELLTALQTATSGDTVILKPGKYSLSQPKISLSAAGTAAKPITVRAEHAGDVVLELNTVDGFLLSGPYWVFENLDIVGTCQPEVRCDHAFHLVGGADNTVIRDSRLREFNAMIKGSTLRDGDQYLAANDVVIERNIFSNNMPRKTSRAVTFIDVVGGNNWAIRSNVIMDFAKDGGNNTSYGAFLKGSSTNGLFDGNLVVCSLSHKGGVRMGLSFGGGGTGKKWLRESFEHKNGTMRNNIVVNCSDAGIYLNKSVDTQIYNNTLLQTAGIDVRFAETSAEIRDNVLSSFINERDGGKSVSENNLTVLMAPNIERLYATEVGAFPAHIQVLEFAARPDTELVDSGSPTNTLNHDFCGNARLDGSPDRGAVEYAAGSEKCGLPIPDIWAHELEIGLQSISAPLKRDGVETSPPTENPDIINRGPLSLDTARGVVLWIGEFVELSPLEFELVQLMSSRPNEVIYNREIINLIEIGNPSLEHKDPVRNIVLSLRRKFRDADPHFSALQYLPQEGVLWRL